MIRCTCLYRPSTPDEQESGSTALTVGVRDPFCPAADLHTRTAEAADARDRERAADSGPTM